MKYTIRAGRYARFEGGKIVTYRAGDEVELTPVEAVKISSLLVAPAVGEPPREAAAAIPPANDEFGAMEFVDQRSAYQIIGAINATSDLDQVRALVQAEASGRGRTTVLRAAEKRITELETVIEVPVAKEDAEVTEVEVVEEP